MLDPAVPQLSSPRLILRQPLAGDADAIRTLADDWEVAHWMARLPHPYRLADAAFFIDHIVPTEPCWAITDRASGRLLGIVGLAPTALPAAAEFGYWLGRPFWGRGFATEASRVVLEHAFAAADLTLLTSGYFAGNTRSANVLDKLGFARRGTSERMSLAHGSELAHVDVTLTRERWRDVQT